MSKIPDDCFTQNRLAVLTKLDRRTVQKRLAGKTPAATVKGLDYFPLSAVLDADPRDDRRHRSSGNAGRPWSAPNKKHWLFEYATSLFLAARTTFDALGEFSKVLNLMHELAKDPKSPLALEVESDMNRVSPAYKKQVFQLLCGPEGDKYGVKLMEVVDSLETLTQGMLDIDATLRITGGFDTKLGLKIVEDAVRRGEIMRAKKPKKSATT